MSRGAHQAGTRLHMRVDPIACKGHGICAELFPERIRLDDWGYPIIDPRGIPGELMEEARRTIAECPRNALSLAPVAGSGEHPHPALDAGPARPPRHSAR